MWRCGFNGGCPSSWLGRWEVFKAWFSNRAWPFVKRWAWILVVIGLIGLGFWLPTTARFQKILAWIDQLNMVYGIIAFVSIQALLTVLFLPGAIFVIFAGFTKGLLLGTLLAWSGSVLGAIGAFLLGRQVIAERVRRWAADSPFFLAVLKAVDSADEGWKITFLLRLSPLTPFALVNYLLSSTQMSLWTYCWTTAIGVLPPTSLYVYLGTTARNLSDILDAITNDDDDDVPAPLSTPTSNSTTPLMPSPFTSPSAMDTTQLWVMGIGVIITIVVAVLITIFSSRAIKRASKTIQDLEGLQSDSSSESSCSEDELEDDMNLQLKEISLRSNLETVGSDSDLLGRENEENENTAEVDDFESENTTEQVDLDSESFGYQRHQTKSSRLSMLDTDSV